MSLRVRLVLLVVALTLPLLFGLGLYLGSGLDRWAEEVLDAQLAERVARIAARIEVERSGEIELEHEDEWGEAPFVVETASGKLLARGGARVPSLARELGTEDRHADTRRAPDGRRWRVLSARVRPSHEGRRSRAPAVVVTVAAPSQPFAALSSRFRAGLLTALALGALLSALGAIAVAQLFLAPIRRLSADVAAIEASSLDQRIRAHRLDPELARLAAAFNGVLDRLQAAFARQQQFVARASHALRTPLAGMLSQAEVTLRRERSVEDHRAVLEDIAASARESAALVEGLLALSRADVAGGGLQREPIALADVADEMRRLFALRAEEAGVTLAWDVPEGLFIDADRARLRELLEALLDNALRYTTAGGEAGLSARDDDDSVVLEVWDTGVGIAPEEVQLVFERFFRGRAADETRKGGTGLGLSVVKAIATAHGATVELVPRAGGGTRALVRWPRRPPPPGSETPPADVRLCR